MEYLFLCQCICAPVRAFGPVSELAPRDSSVSQLTFSLSLRSNDLKSETKRFEVTESPRYSGGHILSDIASDLPLATIIDPSFPSDVSPFDWEGSEIPFKEDSEDNALRLWLDFMPDGVNLEAQILARGSAQVESLWTPHIHQVTCRNEFSNQETKEQQVQLVSQFDNPTDNMLAGGFPQDINPRAAASDASGLKMFRGCQRAHADLESQKGENMGNWPDTGNPDQVGAAAAAEEVSTYAVNDPPYDEELPRTPRMRPIPLPDTEEGSDDNHCSGPGPTSWLVDTFVVMALNYLDRCV